MIWQTLLQRHGRPPKCLLQDPTRACQSHPDGPCGAQIWTDTGPQKRQNQTVLQKSLFCQGFNNLRKPMKTCIKPYVHERSLVFRYGFIGVLRSRNSNALDGLSKNMTFVSKSCDFMFSFLCPCVSPEGSDTLSGWLWETVEGFWGTFRVWEGSRRLCRGPQGFWKVVKSIGDAGKLLVGS